MGNLIKRILGFLLVSILAVAASDAQGLTFKFQTFNVPGALESSAFGVNNAGVAVGYYVDQSRVMHGYIVQGRVLTTIDDPNGTDTFCNNVNDQADFSVVGQYTNAGGAPVGFVYKDGQFTDIPGPAGAIGSSAVSINMAGDIVGYYLDSAGLAHGYLLRGGAYTTLDVPGALLTVATGINDHGTIVLYWLDAATFIESSLYDGRVYSTINVPGAVSSYAYDLDNAGDVLYRWMDSALHNHGALRQAGHYQTFDVPKSTFTFPAGINDHQLIVGGYRAVPNGAIRSFKAVYQ